MRVVTARERLVPILKKDSTQAVAFLFVVDVSNPLATHGRLFVGRLRVAPEDPAIAALRGIIQDRGPPGVTEIAELFDNKTEAVVVARPDGTIVFANAATAALFGWDPGELDGQNVKVLMSGQHAQNHCRSWDCLALGPWGLEQEWTVPATSRLPPWSPWGGWGEGNGPPPPRPSTEQSSSRPGPLAKTQ